MPAPPHLQPFSREGRRERTAAYPHRPQQKACIKQAFCFAGEEPHRPSWLVKTYIVFPVSGEDDQAYLLQQGLLLLLVYLHPVQVDPAQIQPG